MPGLSKDSLSFTPPELRMPALAFMYKFAARKWCRSVGTSVHRDEPRFLTGVQDDFRSARIEREVLARWAFASSRCRDTRCERTDGPLSHLTEFRFYGLRRVEAFFLEPGQFLQPCQRLK